MIQRTYISTKFICLYTADTHLPDHLVHLGKMLVTQGVLTNRHYLLADKHGPAATWASHARAIGIPASVIGTTRRPRSTATLRDYHRVIGATSHAQRDLYMLQLADVVHVFGTSPATLRVYDYARSLRGRHVFWYDDHSVSV